MNAEVINNVIVSLPEIRTGVPASTYQGYCENVARAKAVAVPLAKAFGSGWMVEIMITNTYQDFHLMGEGLTIGGTPADRGCSQHRYEFYAVIPQFDGYSHTHGRISLDVRRKPATLVADIRRRLFSGAYAEMAKAKAKIAKREAEHNRCLSVAKLVASLIGESANSEITRMQQPGSLGVTPKFHYYTPHHGKVEIWVDSQGRISLATGPLEYETGLSLIEQLKGE